ncbi:MAG: type II secretion system F family protein, partial [Planctomycetales bacterium]|nr:type II secretion system F family protein [Planctomycetales bacterium]
RSWRLLLELELPLPEALQLAASATRDPNLAEVGTNVAQRVASGQSLAESFQRVGRIPESVIPVLDWGERQGRLDESLQLLSEAFDQRRELRSDWLQLVMPSVLFVVIACIAIVILAAVMVPLMSMGSLIGSIGTGGGGWGFGVNVELGGRNSLGWIPFGLALLWVAHRYRRRMRGHRTLIFAITCAGWVLLWMGLLGMLGNLGGGPIVWGAVLVVGSMLVNRLREADRRGILALILASMRRQLPLVPVVRAFAVERSDELGYRMERLANYLEEGVPLPQAFARSGNRLPADAMLAAELGMSCLDLGVMPQEMSEQQYWLRREWHVAVGHLLYLVFVTTGFAVALSFVMIYIVPTFRQVALDFEMSLPASMELLIEASDAIVRYAGWLPLLLAELTAFVVCILLIAWFAGWLTWEPWWVRRWMLRYHGTIAMRALAQYVDNDMSLLYGLEKVTQRYPRNYVRQAFRAVLTDVGRGRPWWTAFREQGLIGRVEEGVLQSSQAVGNVGWALREMADRITRRLIFRFRVAIRIVFPFFILIVSIPVFLVGMGIIGFLATLIENLS